MSKTLRAYPALLTATAVALLAFAASTGHLPGVAWRLVALGTGILTAITVRIVHRGSWLVVAAICAAGMQIAGRSLGTPGIDDRPWMVSGGELAASVICSIALVVVLQRRNGALRKRDVVDLAIVLTGVTLVAWVLVINPLVDDGASLVQALVGAAFLPTPILFVTLTSDLMLTGLVRNRSAQLLVAASWLATAAAVVRSLVVTDTISWSTADAVADSAFLAAYLLVCAAATHRDAPEIVVPFRTSGEVRTEAPTRLTLTAPALGAAVVLTAVLPPRSTVDLVVRLVGSAAIVGAIVLRQYVAMRDDRDARLALYRQLHRDGLTGLPARQHFVDHLNDQLERTWRAEARPAIVKLNLDRFKQINDTLGHQEANVVLQTIAQRLQAVAEADGGFAARAGGDDFLFVDAEVTSANAAVRRANELRTAISPPITIGESTVFVTASIGVVVAPLETIASEDLMRRADIASNQAKNLGGDQVALFDDSMEARLSERVGVEQALHGAIDRAELHLYYQPIVDIYEGVVRGFEALVRWERGGRIVSPGVFIPIAEETGLINEIGAWALHTALHDLRAWIDDDIVRPDTTMSVNVSPRQIADPDFADVVRGALDASHIPPQLLWIEMTESMMLQEPELAKSTLRSTAEMGVRLALDDFGTGYSSLSLLQQFPIDRLKIDRAFVQGIADDDNDRSLVRTIIAMAQSMNLDMVAEGVETIQQLGGLREFGCDKAQGFLISRPVPVGTIRSTMVALEELVTLSVFSDQGTERPTAALL